ncbi:hypothetical protein EXE55_20350 [Burkholderia glumae]|nr:hypothetical protein EXE55_20350 [Burkholderia glumae]
MVRPPRRGGQRAFATTRPAEHGFGWLGRFRRLARDYERRPKPPAGSHCAVLVCVKLMRAVRYF